MQDVEHSVLLDGARLAAGHLIKPSRVKVAKLFTLHKSLIVRPVGRLGAADLERIQAELRVLLGL
jgi:hypothetical protein